jgi:hypothetical protein
MRDDASNYDGRSLYTAVLVLEGASVKFRGVTLKEDHHDAIAAGKTPYHEGSIQIRGHSASATLWDARVEFTQDSFINSHGSGITMSHLMHVRWIGNQVDTDTKQYPVTALRGVSRVACVDGSIQFLAS